MRKSRSYWAKFSVACFFALFGISAVAEHFITLAATRRDTQVLQQMVSQMGPSFANVSAHTTSHPHSVLVGTVERQEERDRLEAVVAKRFGADRAHFIVGLVRVIPRTAQSAQSK